MPTVSGELSLFLARQSCDVPGADLSPVAIRQVREKARWRRVDARLLVWDALFLGRLAAGLAFRTVRDSTVVPVQGDARRGDRPGYGIPPAELRERFGPGWAVAFADETVFGRRYGANPAYFVGGRWR